MKSTFFFNFSTGVRGWKRTILTGKSVFKAPAQLSPPDNISNPVPLSTPLTVTTSLPVKKAPPVVERSAADDGRDIRVQ